MSQAFWSGNVRTKLGVILKDLPRLLWRLRPSWLFGRPGDWVFIRNRADRLQVHEQGTGARCDWKWSRDLHAAKVFPGVGGAVMQKAIGQWPVPLVPSLARVTEDVEVSFVVGHRGRERLPTLLTTLDNLAAQERVATEIIVVEQSLAPESRDQLSRHARYFHTPLPRPDFPYNRAWALNVGARQAKGRVVVLHDGDLMVPARYSQEVLRQADHGSEIINLTRFIFYLSREASEDYITSGTLPPGVLPERIVQNCVGGSIAVLKRTFLEVGGLDETFVGWGGEDNEFWNRCEARGSFAFGYLPLIHLWHAAQPEKGRSERSGSQLLEERSSLPPEQRIAQLLSRRWGQVSGPSGSTQ